MNPEPVRTNGRIVAAVVVAVVGSAVALQTAIVTLLLALNVDQSLADAIGQIISVGLTIAGSAVAVLKGAEITRNHTTAWDPVNGALTKDGDTPAPVIPQDEEVLGYIPPTDDADAVG